MPNWEDIFQSWSQPPSATESEKSFNAESGIKKAIQMYERLADKNIAVFAQGSYAANTNIRIDSDVDVCILCRDTFFYDLPACKIPENYNIILSSFYFNDYKNLINSALIDRFGTSGVTRGRKAFDVHSNTYRVDADVVPSFEYRYYNDPESMRYLSGIAFLCDGDNQRIHNYPQQTLENGRLKNVRTNQKYKRVVRILKRLRNEMQEKGIIASKDIASFLIESLVYQVPDAFFRNEKITDDVKYSLSFIFSNLAISQLYSSWTEVNEIKYLFHITQRWTREQAILFIQSAVDYLGLK